MDLAVKTLKSKPNERHMLQNWWSYCGVTRKRGGRAPTFEEYKILKAQWEERKREREREAQGARKLEKRVPNAPKNIVVPAASQVPSWRYADYVKARNAADRKLFGRYVKRAWDELEREGVACTHIR